jgi:hypothetical protein
VASTSSGVVCDILSDVFHLIPGLSAVLFPLLGGVYQILEELGLTEVLKLLTV